MRIVDMPQPVIARIHGIATAAGCQLVSMRDLAVAVDSARFAVSGSTSGCSARRRVSGCRETWDASRLSRCS